MTQIIEHVSSDYFDDLVINIQKKIIDLSPEYFLYHIHYSGLEKEDLRARAFMIFNLKVD